MILRLLHTVASNGFVYDCIQFVAGVRRSYSKLETHIRHSSGEGVVLDIGGGTGSLAAYWPDSTYLCLDIEFPKLQRYRSKTKAGVAIQGDATCLPIATGSVDAVILMLVAHHLGDVEFERATDEIRRVLRPGGRLIFLEPVECRERLRSRVMWKLDRGANPRLPDRLRHELNLKFRETDWEIFYFPTAHKYVIGVFEATAGAVVTPNALSSEATQ